MISTVDNNIIWGLCGTISISGATMDNNLRCYMYLWCRFEWELYFKMMLLRSVRQAVVIFFALLCRSLSSCLASPILVRFHWMMMLALMPFLCDLTIFSRHEPCLSMPGQGALRHQGLSTCDWMRMFLRQGNQGTKCQFISNAELMLGGIISSSGPFLESWQGAALSDISGDLFDPH